MATVEFRYDPKNTAWFTTNAAMVLKAGEPAYHDTTGLFKLGDGVTALSALSFLPTVTPTTPTLQQVLTAGATLSSGHSIQTSGANTLNIFNTDTLTYANGIQFQSGNLILSSFVGLDSNSLTLAPTLATLISPIEADSFIKSGGTSTQFLKADGSVDSSTYLTSLGTAATSLTTTGASGASTLIANVLNVPTYTLAGLGGITPAAVAATYLTIANPAYTGTLTTGTLPYSDTGLLATLQSSTNSYNQLIISNTNSGSSASSNLIVNNDQSTSSTFYGELGMNSSTFTGTGSLSAPNVAYLSARSVDLVLGTSTANSIKFVTNSSANDAMVINSTGNVSISTDLTVPLIIGGSAVGSAITYKSTTGTGTTTAQAHIFTGGTNGATAIASFYNNGQVNIGNAVTTNQRLVRIGQDTAFIDIGSLIGTTSSWAFYSNQTTPSASNYTFAGTASQTRINAATDVVIRIANSTIQNNDLNSQQFTTYAKNNSTVTSYAFNFGNHQILTASVSQPQFLLTMPTLQWGTGALASQTFFSVTAPTISFVGASVATTVFNAFFAAPIQGTNATIINNYAAGFGGSIDVDGIVGQSRTSAANNTLGAGDSSVIVRKYKINSGIKLLINNGATLRIL